MPETIDERLIKKRFPEDKRYVQLRGIKVDLAELCRDPRGVEDDLNEAISQDWAEVRATGWEPRLHPFAEASDLEAMDRVLTDTYPPLYCDIQKVCKDCYEGPCNLEEGKGICGLELEPYQGKLSLKIACNGTLTQFVDTRDLLEYAIKEFGGDKEVSYGKRHDISDQAQTIGSMTGLYVKTLSGLDRALTYAESQLNKLMLAGYIGSGSTFDFENMTFHAGSMLLVAQEVSELVKASCFGFQKSGDHDMIEMRDWPPANISGGVASIEKGKPVITFLGDNFLPAWNAINYLKDNGLSEKVEVAGIGSVALDVARFYDRVRPVATMLQAAKTLRLGFSDVIVASTGGSPINILDEAKKTDSKLIWVSPVGLGGLPDRTDDPGEEVLKDLIGGVDAVWVRDVDKVGEIAVRLAQEVKRKGDYVFSDAEVKEKAKSCRDDCDLCFNACPNSLLLGSAVRRAKSDGISALVEMERGCFLCGRCERACPENIPIPDMLVSALAKRVPDDKYIMRGGRGTVPEDEIARSAFTLFNSTGFLWVISEGGSKEIDEVGWILDYLVNKGAICCVAGDAAIEAARHFDEQKKKYIFEKYSCEYAVKNLIPLGSDSSVVFLQEATSHWTRTGVHISHYANFPEMADVNYKLLGAATIMWGRWTDRMYSMAAGLVRSGHQILCGPVSGFGLKRLFLGNHFDRSKWHVWDTATGRELEAEPGQEHMIFPVETKEELITCIWGIGQKPGSSVSLARVLTLTPYIENHEKYFGELPDDWPYFVTNAQDLPIRHKMRLLKILREEYGWETDGAYITKIRARDGNLYTTEDFAYKFTTHEARFFTKSPKFMTKEAKDLFRKEGKKI